MTTSMANAIEEEAKALAKEAGADWADLMYSGQRKFIRQAIGKRAQRHQEEVKKREEMLLTELLGETVKVRHKGYKTMRAACVEAHEKRSWKGSELVPDGYRIVFDWKDDEGRSNQVSLMRRLDVMTDEGWATVWDDGTDDLGFGKLATSAKPTGLKYKSGML